MKEEILVRFANETIYNSRINIDPEKIKDQLIFPKEVFFTIDNVRVAVKKDDWDELQNKLQNDGRSN
jgi:hypothetical protein